MTSTAYPTNTTFLAHSAHVSRGKQDDSCRICADNGAFPITWGEFVRTYPEWAIRDQCLPALEDPAEVALQETSNEGLLRTFAALTHHMHIARDNRDYIEQTRHREQRDRVEAEILRRMGSAS